MRTLWVLAMIGCTRGEEVDPTDPSPTPVDTEDPGTTPSVTGDTAESATTGDTATSPTVTRRYTKLSAGEQLTCALFDDGEIGCAGSTRWTIPAAPPGPFVDVVASWDTVCGVRDTGALECWGCDWLSSLCSPPGGTSWASVDAASEYFCAQDVDGGVACWNANGALSYPYGPDPGTVFGGYAVGVTGFIGIRPDNGHAQGYGEAQTPPGVLVEIAAGRSAACGIRADDGAASCVAYNGPPLPSGIAMVDGYDADFCWLDTAGHADCAGRHPDAVRDGFDPATEVFASITTGSDHACAVTVDGRGFCWPRDGRPETSGILEVP